MSSSAGTTGFNWSGNISFNALGGRTLSYLTARGLDAVLTPRFLAEASHEALESGDVPAIARVGWLVDFRDDADSWSDKLMTDVVHVRKYTGGLVTTGFE